MQNRLLSFGMALLTLGVIQVVDPAVGSTTTPFESSPQAPIPLTEAINSLVSAANRQDLEGVMVRYGPSFKHQDGLDREETRSAIAALWQRHPQLTYEVTLKSWQQQGSDIIAILDTRLTGQETSERGTFQLSGSTQVRNRYRPDPSQPRDLQLVEQEVLQESLVLKSGDTPPTLTVKVPNRVRPGAVYPVEAVVAEPIRDKVLAGAVLEEPISSGGYTNLSAFRLAPLQAGGLFRTADAPSKPGSSWISFMLVNDGGMVIESHRVTFTARTAP